MFLNLWVLKQFRERERKKRNTTYFFTPVILRAVAEKHKSKNSWPWHCANYFTICKGLSSNVLIVPVKCFSSISNSVKPETWYLSLSSTHFYTLLTSTSLQIKIVIETAFAQICMPEDKCNHICPKHHTGFKIFKNIYLYKEYVSII